MQHCARHADYYGWGTLLYLKKSICIHSACKRSSGATLAAALAAFEFLAIFFLGPSGMQYITIVVEIFIIPYGEIALVVSQEIITKTISIQYKKHRSWRLMRSNSWSNSRRDAPLGCYTSWGKPVLNECLARPE